MNKRTPVPGYGLLPSQSMKQKLKDNHYDTPCIIEQKLALHQNVEEFHQQFNGAIKHSLTASHNIL